MISTAKENVFMATKCSSCTTPADCRKQFDLEELTDEQLRFGYDIIADLWADNEREGNNNVLDGTFAKDP